MKKLKEYQRLIGDGKFPNKYFLFVSSDYMYYDSKEHTSEWIGDITKGFKSKGDFIGEFKTYKEAKEYINNNLYIGQAHNGTGYAMNRITIELFEMSKTLLIEEGRFIEDTHEDINFTKKENRRIRGRV